MKATEARTTLLAQHEQLRLLLDTCIRLAQEQRAGEPVTAELDEALAELRDGVIRRRTRELVTE